MRATAFHLRGYLYVTVLLLVAPMGVRANPLCATPPFNHLEKPCDFTGSLFATRQMAPSGMAELPTVDGIPLAVPQKREIPATPAPTPHPLPLRLLAYGLAALLAVAVAAITIVATQPFLNNLKTPGCPICGSSDIRISFAAGFVDWIFGLFSCPPFRCKVCYCRFHKVSTEGGDFISEPPKPKPAPGGNL